MTPKFIKPTYLYVAIFVKKWFQITHQNFVYHQSTDTNKQTMWPVSGADLGFSEGGAKPNSESLNWGLGDTAPKSYTLLGF